ncbi:MAG: hypothetical protein H6622_01090 [Halobacteriovoraceae bacterium]|nr:hypothetical protein [Halobacteriovoraceae bacterium]
MRSLFLFLIFISDVILANPIAIEGCEVTLSSQKKYKTEIYLKTLDVLHRSDYTLNGQVELDDFQKLLLKIAKIRESSNILQKGRFKEFGRLLDKLDLKGQKILVFGEGQISQQKFIHDLGKYTRDEKFKAPEVDIPSDKFIPYSFTFYENILANQRPGVSPNVLKSNYPVEKESIFERSSKKDGFRSKDEILSLSTESYPKELYQSSFSAGFENVHFINSPSSAYFRHRDTEFKKIIESSDVILIYATKNYEQTIESIKYLSTIVNENNSKKIMIILDHNISKIIGEGVEISSEEYARIILNNIYPDFLNSQLKGMFLGAWKLEYDILGRKKSSPIEGLSSNELGENFKQLERMANAQNVKKLEEFSKSFMSQISKDIFDQVIHNQTIDFLVSLFTKIIEKNSQNSSSIKLDDKILDVMKANLKEYAKSNKKGLSVKAMIQDLRSNAQSGDYVSGNILFEFINEIDIDIALNETLNSILHQLTQYGINQTKFEVRKHVIEELRKMQEDWYRNIIQTTTGYNGSEVIDDFKEFVERNFIYFFVGKRSDDILVENRLKDYFVDTFIGKIVQSPKVKRTCRDSFVLASTGAFLGTVLMLVDVENKSNEKRNLKKDLTPYEKYEPFINGFATVTGIYGFYTIFNVLNDFSSKKKGQCDFEKSYAESYSKKGMNVYKEMLMNLQNLEVRNIHEYVSVFEEAKKIEAKVQQNVSFNPRKNPLLTDISVGKISEAYIWEKKNKQNQVKQEEGKSKRKFFKLRRTKQQKQVQAAEELKESAPKKRFFKKNKKEIEEVSDSNVFIDELINEKGPLVGKEKDKILSELNQILEKLDQE